MKGSGRGGGQGHAYGANADPNSIVHLLYATSATFRLTTLPPRVYATYPCEDLFLPLHIVYVYYLDLELNLNYLQ